MAHINRPTRDSFLLLSDKVKIFGNCIYAVGSAAATAPSARSHSCGFADSEWPCLSPLPHKPQQGCTKMPEQQISVSSAGTTELSHSRIIQTKVVPPPPLSRLLNFPDQQLLKLLILKVKGRQKNSVGCLALLPSTPNSSQGLPGWDCPEFQKCFQNPNAIQQIQRTSAQFFTSIPSS